MKELEDHAWFPGGFRNYQTAFTGFVSVHSGAYIPFIRHLENIPVRQTKMHDLCSGSGEPAITIFKKVRRFTHLALSDLFPSSVAVPDNRVLFLQSPADVLQLKFNPDNCYTMYNAFHHFSDEEKQKLIHKMQESTAPGFIVEVLEPTFTCFLKILLATTIGCLLFTPFIRPFSFRRLFFTYILPVNLLTISFDGVVSVFKSRSEKYYRKLFRGEKNVSVLRLKNYTGSLVVIQINS